jgi:hypothetical protein
MTELLTCAVPEREGTDDWLAVGPESKGAEDWLASAPEREGADDWPLLAEGPGLGRILIFT